MWGKLSSISSNICPDDLFIFSWLSVITHILLAFSWYNFFSNFNNFFLCLTSISISVHCSSRIKRNYFTFSRVQREWIMRTEQILWLGNKTCSVLLIFSSYSLARRLHIFFESTLKHSKFSIDATMEPHCPRSYEHSNWMH